VVVRGHFITLENKCQPSGGGPSFWEDGTPPSWFSEEAIEVPVGAELKVESEVEYPPIAPWVGHGYMGPNRVPSRCCHRKRVLRTLRRGSLQKVRLVYLPRRLLTFSAFRDPYRVLFFC
jgi:hypothetical protein